VVTRGRAEVPNDHASRMAPPYPTPATTMRAVCLFC
jgi:hypothetical protein